MSDERTRRYADAIDSVLADEFMTSAVTKAVMAIADAERADALRDAAAAIRRNEQECLVQHSCHKADLISIDHRALLDG